MAGKPQGNTPRSQTVTLRLTPQGVEELDRLRGSTDRSTFLRGLLSKAAAEGRKA